MYFQSNGRGNSHVLLTPHRRCEITLEKRIEYLSLAINCAKSYQGPRVIQMMDMVRRLEQDLEVANAQLLHNFSENKKPTLMEF